ncbi:MAG: copper resistance protein NlpE [Methylococcaceae bacterium]
MKILTILLKQKLILIFLSSLSIIFNPAMAESNLNVKEKSQKHSNHSKDTKLVDKNQKQFHGVFYGYLPCEDCDGTQTTLSLKNKNNYLLVTQPAKASSREFFDKGKYTWDDETNTVTLTSRKTSSIKKYHIENGETLFMLDTKGNPIKGEKNKYSLRKRDMKQSTKMHNH